MRDFNERFERKRQKFDRDFERAQKWGIVGFIISAALGFGVLGFIVWVIIMLLQFFGVIGVI